MRKRAFLALFIVAVIAAFFLIRSSSPEKPTDGTGPAATTTSPSGRSALRPGTLPAAAASGSAGPLAGEEAKGQPVFFAKWGSGLDQLGHERPEEANAVGPMSLAVDSRGRVHVLDAVNNRVVRRGEGGKPDLAIRMDLTDTQDIAIGADGAMAALDRYVDKSVLIYDDTGVLKGELPIEGEGVTDVGEVTGVFVDGNDVYVEREHGALVKIGDTAGMPAEPRSEIPGRPSRDGLSFLSAGITDAPTGRVYVSSIERATSEHRFTRELRLNAFVRSIVLLGSDKAGTIYFAAEVEQDGEGIVVLQCLEPLKGIPVGGALLPINTLPEESFRDFAVLEDGGVIEALRSEAGVTYTRYDCE